MPDINLAKRIVYVTGLPRAGSTLLCQLLGHHPEIYSAGHSSPLAHTMDGMRTSWSRDAFLLAQMDVDFDLAYRRLANAYRGFMNGWFAESEKKWVVDKNRGWLGMAETVRELDPDFRMLVCIRELTQLYGSIESQHQKTQLLDSGDNTAGMTRYGRASAYFNGDGLVARCLTAVQSAMGIFRNRSGNGCCTSSSSA
jgi:sulfotransferase